ncbi:MAG: hypothetical protein QXD48_02400 [Candidatus Aenigmatarchaeota archaeon]
MIRIKSRPIELKIYKFGMSCLNNNCNGKIERVISKENEYIYFCNVCCQTYKLKTDEDKKSKFFSIFD